MPRWFRDQPAPVALAVVGAIWVLAACSQLGGLLPTLGPASATTGPTAVIGAALPGTSRPAITSSPAALPRASSGSANAGGQSGSHAIICLTPVTAAGGGGPPCVPVSQAATVMVAIAVLTTGERTAMLYSTVALGDAACRLMPEPIGCRGGTVVGTVTFHLTGGYGAVRVLVYHDGSGPLRAERLS
jgi:hypothetical protein